MNYHSQTCHNCGEKNPISNKVCAFCGKRLKAKGKQSGSQTDQPAINLLEGEITRVNGVFNKIRVFIAVLLAGIAGVILLFALNPTQLRGGVSALMIVGFVLLAALLIFSILGWWYGIKKMWLLRKLKAMPVTEREVMPAAVESGMGKQQAQKKTSVWAVVLTVIFVLLVLAFSLRLIVPIFLDTFGFGPGNLSAGITATFVDLREGLLNLLGLSSGGSGGGACAGVPVKVISCTCSDQNSQGVWCDVESGASGCYTDANGVNLCTNGLGEGRIPYACTQELGLCQ